MKLKNKSLFGLLFGVRIDFICIKKLFSFVFEAIEKKEKRIVGYINVRGANLAYEDKRFLSYYKKCDWVTIDGVGIVIALKALGFKTKKKHRFTCPDYLDTLLEDLSLKKKSIFFLGGTPEVAEKMREKLNVEFPNLLFDVQHGFFDKKGPSNQDVVDRINRFKPNILYLGFGMPLQEFWILDNYDELETNVILPLGACMDFFSNSVYRGPRILNDNGFEWLVRLFTEPKRLWRRYLIGNPIFIYRVLKEKFR